MKKILIWVLVSIIVIAGAITGIVLGTSNNSNTEQQYTVTFMIDGEAVGTDVYTKSNKELNTPQIPERVGYTAAWEDVALTTGDVTINAIYTPIQYNISFVANGLEVGTGTYTVEDNETIQYPQIPEKKCYSGEWEEVTLTTGDVTISVVYTLTGHTFGEWDNGYEATCTENGEVGHKHCSVCEKDFDQDGNEIANIVIPAGHDYVWMNEVLATCTENGEIGHYHCSACGKDFDEDGNEITDLAILAEHNYVWVNEVSATCTEDGIAGHYECSKCGDIVDENYQSGDLTIPAHHTFGEWQSGYGATCSEPGEVGHYHCSVCGKDFDQDGNEIADIVIPAEHDYVWVNEVPATCTENGTVGHYECSRCGDIVDENYDPITNLTIRKGHDEVWIPQQDATCTEDGVVGHYHCSKCGRNANMQGQTIDDITIPAHHTLGDWQDEIPSENGENGTKGHYHCSACEKDFDQDGNEIEDLNIYPSPYQRINKNGTLNSEGDYIYFGSYPQTIKANNVTIISDTPNEKGYYLGSDGEYYAKVTATPISQYSGYTFSTGASVTQGEVYYFKVEPIKWRILTIDDGSALIMCDSIISSGKYYQDRVDRTNGDDTIYPNNYKESDIRAWLNDNFYQTAFSDLEKQIIELTLVDNSARSTNTDSNPTKYNNGESIYACEDTEDYVFLLSTQEVTTYYGDEIGFSTYDYAYNIYRDMSLSDYSLAIGAKRSKNYNNDKYYGNWMLRSPYTNSMQVRCVSYMGNLDFSEYVDQTYLGIVPALRISL